MPKRNPPFPFLTKKEKRILQKKKGRWTRRGRHLVSLFPSHAILEGKKGRKKKGPRGGKRGRGSCRLSSLILYYQLYAPSGEEKRGKRKVCQKKKRKKKALASFHSLRRGRKKRGRKRVTAE